MNLETGTFRQQVDALRALSATKWGDSCQGGQPIPRATVNLKAAATEEQEMKSKLSVLPLLLIVLATNAGAQQSILSVTVECKGEDSIGASVCYAVKEKLRASRGFQFTSTLVEGGFCIHLVSLNFGNSNVNETSVIAETFTRKLSGSVADVEVFMTTGVQVVGATRVDPAADNVVAYLDSTTNEFRHSATPALHSGLWVFMVSVDGSVPLSQWGTVTSFGSEKQCRDYQTRLMVDSQKRTFSIAQFDHDKSRALVLGSKCVSSDDPRLK